MLTSIFHLCTKRKYKYVLQTSGDGLTLKSLTVTRSSIGSKIERLEHMA